MANYGLSVGDQLKIQRLRKDGLDWDQVGHEMGMVPSFIRKILDPKYLRTVTARSQKRAAELREVSASKRRAGVGAESRGEKAPLSILIERDRRLASGPRDLTAVLMGDPPMKDWYKRP